MAELAQIYDCTVMGELADVPGVVRLEGVAHLAALDPTGNVASTKYWDEAFRLAGVGEDLWLNIECDTVSRLDWRRPTDPGLSSLEEVRNTHALFAQKLEPLLKLAAKTGAKVWIYRWFSPTKKRRVDIAGKNPAKWLADLDSLDDLRYSKYKSLGKYTKKTDGGELFECYIQADWNTEDFWAETNCVMLVERPAAALKENGMNGIPLLRFTTSDTREPIRTKTMRSMLYNARQRGPIAIWNGWGNYAGGEKYPKITPEQKALLR